MQGVVAVLNAPQQRHKRFFEVIRLARQQAQRRGIGNPVGELRLVDVEAYSADGRGDIVARKACRCQRAADFIAANIYIIGPLDLSGKWQVVSGKEVGYGEGEGLGELELALGGEPCGLEHKAEGEV